MNTDKIYAEAIAKEYASRDTTKVVALKKLDQRARMPATVFTYTFGVTSALILGVGMCLSMGVLGGGSTFLFILGIVLGILGIAGVSINYPLYKRILEKGKQKYAFEIMELAKEVCDAAK